ncbi:MAG: DUF1573 domain-containing protein [Peptococcaceae bacterium]|nr:DUF1573 domain-containing protein [Peptococcaceae bacterium]
MNEIQCSDFQSAVSRFLLRNQSILDLMGKCQDTSARVNRAVVKAVTSCGCIEVHASKPQLPQDASLDDLRELLSSHVEGQLCDNCRDALMREIGRNLFYLTALCNVFDISLQDVLQNETEALETLGKFSLA